MKSLNGCHLWSVDIEPAHGLGSLWIVTPRYFMGDAITKAVRWLKRNKLRSRIEKANYRGTIDA